MSYTALYRKFRPLKFEDMVGQEHITKTLRNQITSGRIGHAYLFNGGRGTGKTTSAKILARAVNCLNPQDGEPCNECEICKEILEGSLTDVVEMDAASNNSVDDIRSIRDEVNFLPTLAKYRVYIIDEVHMLSVGAFNALLKTLEEPPEHVKFILATTEPQKLPTTILSRCQRFDFKKIKDADIIKRLKQVKIDNLISLLFIVGSLLNIYANGITKEYILSNDPKKEKKANDIYSFVLFLTLFIYFYFAKRNYSFLKKSIENNEDGELEKIRFLGTVLLIIGLSFTIYAQVNDSNDEGEPII